MTGFILDEETIASIVKELPNLDRLAMVLALNPDAISMKFSPESNVPVAAVCLQDTFMAVQYVRIGLNECLQHKVWYRKKCSPPNEELAVIFMRFYLDGIISQLYAAGEHLANAIILMLELNESDLRGFRRHKTSQQSIVGSYLRKERPQEPITRAVLMLARSREWQQCINYRGDWAHNQAPTVKGLGAVYERRRRWIQSEQEGRYILGIGSGDEAKYSIDEVLTFVSAAISQFLQLLEKTVDVYQEILDKKGIMLGEDGLHVKII